jgi:hypothetical protein
MEQIEERTRLPPGTPAATAAASAFRIARQSPPGPWRGPGSSFGVGSTATPCSRSMSSEIAGRGRSAASHRPRAYEERAAGGRGGVLTAERLTFLEIRRCRALISGRWLVSRWAREG